MAASLGGMEHWEVSWRDRYHYANAPAALKRAGRIVIYTILTGIVTWLIFVIRKDPTAFESEWVFVLGTVIVAVIGGGSEWCWRLATARTNIQELRLQQASPHLVASESKGPLVEVETFHEAVAQLWVKNVSGAHDEFTVQVVGWESRDDVPLQEARGGYDTYWGGLDGNTRTRLHVDEKARIDFAWLVHYDGSHAVTEEGTRPSLEVHVAGLDRMLFKNRSGFSYHSYDHDPAKLKPIHYRFRLRFTAKNANRSQEVSVALDVVGRREDHPQPELTPIRFLKPCLWLSVCDEGTTP